jgi:hypothetical protein
MSKTLRKVALATVVVMIAASCSSSDDSSDSSTDSASPATTALATDPPATDPPATDPPATDPPTTDPPATDRPATDPPVTEPLATDAPPSTEAPALPTTPVVAVLDRAYYFTGGEPAPGEAPAEPGDVEAHWYSSGDVLAVVYVGLSPLVDACPGNSLQLADGFEFVSNAPLPSGSCDDFPTLIDNSADQGVQICGDRVGYLSLIPTGVPGTLFASIERPDPDVTGVGVTGLIDLPDPSILPEITHDQLAC